MKREEQQEDAEGTLGQTEKETRTPALLALGSDAADREDLRDLAVLLDDTLAVQQAEAVTADTLVVNGLRIEEMSQLFFSHSCPSICDRDLHIVVSLCGGHVDTSLLGCKLSGIIHQRVQHEQRQDTVGLHLGIGLFHLEGDAFHLQTLATFSHNIKQRLEREGLNLQVQLALP